MANLTVTTHVQAPVEHTFEVFADLRGAPERIPEITSLEILGDGEIGVGTRFRETRVMLGKARTEEMEITEYQPGSGYAVECESCGSLFRSAFRFSAAPEGGTDVVLDMAIIPRTFFAKLTSPAAALMMGSMKKALGKDMERLKAAAEGSPS